MSTDTATIAYCEHDEVKAACLECLAMPKKVTPPKAPTPRATKNPSSARDKISPSPASSTCRSRCARSTAWSDRRRCRPGPSPTTSGGPAWIYLRCDGRLMARVKATKVIWEDDRRDLADPERDLGPGIAIQVDSRTWDPDIDIDLGQLAAQQRDGFRYLMTNDDDSVTHYRGGKPIVDLDEDEIDLTD